MDLSKVRAFLENGAATLKSLEPVAAFGGPAVQAAVKIAGALAEVGENALSRMAEAGEVVSAADGDEARIREILAEIQAENDKLAQTIAAG